jgi:hypothetical protein
LQAIKERCVFHINVITEWKFVLQVGGPYWDVPVGRLDSKKASLDLANRDIPTAQQGLVTLIAKFWEKGLDATDMVALVGMFFFSLQCYNSIISSIQISTCQWPYT